MRSKTMAEKNEIRKEDTPKEVQLRLQQVLVALQCRLEDFRRAIETVGGPEAIIEPSSLEGDRAKLQIATNEQIRTLIRGLVALEGVEFELRKQFPFLFPDEKKSE